MSNDLRRVSVVVSSEGLSDFPTFYNGDQAAGLLAAWTASWRPALLAATGELPTTLTSYELHDVESASGQLILVPDASRSPELTNWLAKAEHLLGNQVGIIAADADQSFAERGELIAAMANCPLIEKLLAENKVDSSVETEFFALGYAYLQVELLTTGLSYGGVFDYDEFERQTIAAARATLAGETPAMETSLTRCYDLLEQQRSHSYAAEIHLLDIVLLAETTLGEDLTIELADPSPKSLLLSSQLAEQISETNPNAWQTIRPAIAAERLTLAAGGDVSNDLALLSPEMLRDEFATCLTVIEQAAGKRPTVFGQLSSSLPPRLFQALKQNGFTGALLTGFDGGEPPYGPQAQSHAVGVDGQSLPAVIAAPHDLAEPETLLAFANKLTMTLEHHHTATLLLAGWAGRRHQSLDDLRTVARRSGVLGRFVTLEQYLADAPPPDHTTKIEAHQFGPTVLTPTAGANSSSADSLAKGLQSLAEADVGENPAESLAEKAGFELGQGHETDQTFVVNALSFPRVVHVGCDGWARSGSESHPTGSHVRREPVFAEVPACGFAVAKPINTTGPPRVEGLVIRNEHLQVTVEPESGGIQALLAYGTRRNLLSQRLVVGRTYDRRGWLAMQADRIDPVLDSPVGGSLQTTGRVIDADSAVIARFAQTVTLLAKSPGLLLEIEIEPTAADRSGLWLASRCKFADTAWDWYRGVQWMRLPVSKRDFVATDYAHLASPNLSLTIAHAAPHTHRRPGGNSLDTLLAGPEKSGKYRFLFTEGRRPLQAALDLQREPLACRVAQSFSAAAAGWWLHLDAANLVVSQIEPMGEGRRGVRLRIIETEGRSAAAKLRLWQPIKAACRVNANGAVLPLGVIDGAVQLQAKAYDWLELEVSW